MYQEIKTSITPPTYTNIHPEGVSTTQSTLHIQLLFCLLFLPWICFGFFPCNLLSLACFFFFSLLHFLFIPASFPVCILSVIFLTISADGRFPVISNKSHFQTCQINGVGFVCLSLHRRRVEMFLFIYQLLFYIYIGMHERICFSGFLHHYVNFCSSVMDFMRLQGTQESDTVIFFCTKTRFGVGNIPKPGQT